MKAATDRPLVISPLDLRDRRGAALEHVAQGGRVLIRRYKKAIAYLVPVAFVDQASDAQLSSDDAIRLQLIGDVPTDELSVLVSMYEGRKSIKEVIRLRLREKAARPK